jgi:hypothetical protein
MMGVDLPQLVWQPDQDVNFELLYLHMANHMAKLTEEKDARGERIHTDACQWMDHTFSTQALKDKLVWHSAGSLRTLWAVSCVHIAIVVGTCHVNVQQDEVEDMKRLDQACEAALGSDLTPDNPVTTVPARPGVLAVGMSPPTQRLRLWQLGFGEQASMKGATWAAACSHESNKRGHYISVASC